MDITADAARIGSKTEGPIDGLARLRPIAASAPISDNLDRLRGAVGIRPFHRGGTMIGRARTVRTRSGDNLTIQHAMDALVPGEVLVIDAGGDERRAVIGELIVAIAKYRGAVGIVVDGAIRDLREIANGDFPVFARSVIHLGPYKNGPGELDVSVSIGGMVVEPGDVVVGDEDGVVSFPYARLEQVTADVERQIERENNLLATIRDGTYTGLVSNPHLPKS